MTRKDFKVIAELIKYHTNKPYGFINTKPFVEDLTVYLAGTNPKFDQEKFLVACGFSLDIVSRL